MNRRELTLVAGIGIGVLAIALAKKLLERRDEPNAESLAADLRRQLDALERKVSRVLS